MDIGAVATALAGLVDNVTGVNAYDYVPTVWVAPCGVVVLREANYRAVMADLTETTATFGVTIYVPAGDPRDGLHRLYAYASPEGSLSIPAAIMADEDLSVAGCTSVVARLDGIDQQVTEDGSVAYVGTFTVEVMG